MIPDQTRQPILKSSTPLPKTRSNPLWQVLLLALILVTLSSQARAESDNSLVIGGPLRFGGFNLSDNAKEKLDTSVSFDNRQLENALGQMAFARYSYQRYGIGLRWFRYNLSGSTSEITQTLDLKYSFVTLSATFLEGNYLHPKLTSRLGVLIGKGTNALTLKTESNKALAEKTVNASSVSSTGDAELYELFFEAVTKTGWGYQMGYFSVDTNNHKKVNGAELDGTSAFNIYLTIIWRFR